MKFTKADLKPYMRVITRNGDFHIYLEDLGILLDASGCFLEIDDFDDDLCTHHPDDYAVIEVGVPYGITTSIDFDADWKSIWKRKESTEEDSPPSDEPELVEDSFPLEGKIATIDGVDYRLTAVKDSD